MFPVCPQPNLTLAPNYPNSCRCEERYDLPCGSLVEGSTRGRKTSSRLHCAWQQLAQLRQQAAIQSREPASAAEASTAQVHSSSVQAAGASLTPMVALITNSEVLQVLKDRGADGKSGGRAQGSEKLAHQYLEINSAGVREATSLNEFIALLQPFGLTRTEVLSVINTCPSSMVEMYLLVDHCDTRLTEEQVEQVLDLVAMHLKH